jgi:hypothetical protein
MDVAAKMMAKENHIMMANLGIMDQFKEFGLRRSKWSCIQEHRRIYLVLCIS